MGIKSVLSGAANYVADKVDRAETAVKEKVASAEATVKSVASSVNTEAGILDVFDKPKVMQTGLGNVQRNLTKGETERNFKKAQQQEASGDLKGAKQSLDMAAAYAKHLNEKDQQISFESFKVTLGPDGKAVLESTSGKVTRGRATAEVNATGQTWAELIQTTRDQVDVHERMASMPGGKKLDPRKLSDVRTYFDWLSTKKPPASAEQIRDEYAKYLKAYYRYADVKNDEKGWAGDPDGWAKGLRKGGKAQQDQLDAETRDLARRPYINCVGYSEITREIFGKNPRFDVRYAGWPRKEHVYVGVYEKKTGKGFQVNTNVDSKQPVVAGPGRYKTTDEQDAHLQGGDRSVVTGGDYQEMDSKRPPH